MGPELYESKVRGDANAQQCGLTQTKEGCLGPDLEGPRLPEGKYWEAERGDFCATSHDDEDEAVVVFYRPLDLQRTMSFHDAKVLLAGLRMATLVLSKAELLVPQDILDLTAVLSRVVEY